MDRTVSVCHREERERRGDLSLHTVILNAAKNLTLYPSPRLPRGVYPERKFFDKLRMSGRRARNDAGDSYSTREQQCIMETWKGKNLTPSSLELSKHCHRSFEVNLKTSIF